MLQPETTPVNSSDVLNSFSEQAALRPHAECVRCADRLLSYSQVQGQAEQVAGRLRQLGVGPGSLVGVYLNRSVDLVVAILGVLLAGAAYLPVDPLIPEKRMEYMLEDAAVSLIITEPVLQPKLASHPSRCFGDLLQNGLSASGAINTEARDSSLAYVIYTSGSTGRPKGVEVPHRALSLNMGAVRQQLAIGPSDTLLAVTSQSFDVFAMEMFLALTSGCRLVLLPPNHVMQSDLLRAALEENNVTVLFGTPTLWRLVLESGWKGNPQLRGVVGGETLDPDLARSILQKIGTLWNHYGPTEATIVATTYRVQPADRSIPIGFPLPDAELLIVDAANTPVSKGTAGELLIGGDILALGYRNHPELTAARFVYLEQNGGAPARFYRTGDVARQRPDNAFEFVGRLDNQIKIRGFRIELEEIETVLAEHPDVLETAVVTHDDEQREKTLVAYYRSRSAAPVATDSLRGFLAARVPSYMVPSHFVELAQFPITVNGKIDRLDLSRRELQTEDASSAPLPPSSDPVIRDLLAIWKRILRHSAVRPNDNFFEVGGHSLLAARLFTEIRERFGVALPLATLFNAPTVEMLARVIAKPQKPAWSPLVPIRLTGCGSPFFCVHPIGGNVLIFKKLSEHLRSRPFYGLQARGLNGEETPHTNIEAMAADYLRYVREVQPQGPYLLGGYSAGGLVAFEMARLLLAAGERVEPVVLLDTYLHPRSVPPSVPRSSRPALSKALNGVSRRFWQIRSLEPDKRSSVLGRDVARLWSTIKLKTYSQSQRLGRAPFRLDAVSAFLLALQNYRPTPLNTDVILFLADENAPATAANLATVWQHLVEGTLDVIHLSVDHDRLLDEPSVTMLASEIEGRMAQHAGVRSNV
jgi:amino acid adenylation domain-containing protein